MIKIIAGCYLMHAMLSVVAAQDLLSILQQSELTEREFVYQTFKGTRVINGQSIEMKGKGELEFIIGHRFGRINDGPYHFFGWDQAYIRFGLEYGITSKLGIGVGRSSHNKIFDGYLKYRVLGQRSGGGFPVTVAVLTSSGIQTFSQHEAAWRELPFISKQYYSSHILIARKFNPKFSFQLSPAFIHVNRVNQEEEKNNQIALGFSGRYKINGSIAINGEYFYRANAVSTTIYDDCISLGFDIETGGHVFQLVFSNTQGMIDRTFIGATEGNFFKGDIHFGFNITRTFQLKKKRH